MAGNRSFLFILLLLGCCCCWDAVAMETDFADERTSELPSVKSSGNASLVSLFDLHWDARHCLASGPTSRMYSPGVPTRPVNPTAAQRMLAALWALEWLNERNILGDATKMGMSGYSTCSDVKTALRRTIHSLSSLGVLDCCHGNDTNRSLIGYVGPAAHDSEQAISGLLTSLNVSHESLHVTSLEAEIQAASAVLDNLQWKQVALIADNEKIRKQFHDSAGRMGICVTESFLLTKLTNYSEIFPVLRTTGTQVIVFLGLDFQLRRAVEEAIRLNQAAHFYWIVLGPTAHHGFRLLPHTDPPPNYDNIFFVQSSQSKVPGFDDYLSNIPESVELDDDLRGFLETCHKGNVAGVQKLGGVRGQICAPILSNDVLSVAENVAKLTERFRASRNSCLGDAANNETSECGFAGDYLLQVPQLRNEQLNVSLIVYQVGPQKELRFVEVGYYVNNQLNLRKEDLRILHDVGSGWFRVPHFRCAYCPCANDPDRSRDSSGDEWVVDSWFAACGAVACVCATAAIAVCVFIVVRLCRGDAMEGSQAFAGLILFGIIFTCYSTVPFIMPSTPITCNLRPILVGVDFALLFSPLLSRSLMLATSDPDGLLGHVSGLVQSALFLFMVAVQLGLGAQQWFLMSEHGTNPSLRFDGVECVFSWIDYSLALSYPTFLLILLLIVTPFCIRSRRNYHEGLHFHITTLLLVCSWFAWIAVFFVLDAFWKQRLVCFGQVCTSVIMLIFIFIPRVFKMFRAIALDNSGLRSVGNCTMPSLTDMNMRSSNAMIYETVNHAYAPEPVMLNGDGIKSPELVCVKSNGDESFADKSSTLPLETSTPSDGIVDQPPPPLLEEEELTTEMAMVPPPDPPIEEENETEAINEEDPNSQRKPPTVTHL